ncbi:polyketide synthase [Rhodopirellula sp. MGV]|uniref:polyketide synthase n=1 Tax=Rhodopirellula sp. MGV TaxID=2023130 RepID=UPI000B9706AE|nr:polyketide synthase [Rhodopirellula sp. MGV]OYP28868.1 polyketide synthase [Rhodopirellula sp. MGV]PNY37018.1 polyketide synthase [Rhodopirellula baltica]
MFDPKVQSLLESLRRRIRRYVVWDSLLAMAAILLAAFWIGLLIDYVPVTLGGDEMPRSARSVLVLGVGLTLLLVMTRMLLSRLNRSLPDDSLALLVERHHRSLGGRLVTAVQLSKPGRDGDAHSADLLAMVCKEAAAEIDRVDPKRVFRSEPLVHKALVVGPLLIMVIAFAVYSPNAFARAAARLTLMSDAKWPRRAHLEMVGVDVPTISAASTAPEEMNRLEFTDGVVRLPIGSNPTLRIQANTEDFEVPSVCTLYYQMESGTRGQSNFRRVGRERDGYQAFVLDGPPLSNLGESFTFSVLGLDDRLNDFRVEAVQPPAIAEMNVRVRYPEYLRESSTLGTDGEFDVETAYQAGLRISEGSDVTLEAVTSSPIGHVDVSLEYQGRETLAQSIEVAKDRRSFRVHLGEFRNPTAIRLVPASPDGISAQAPFRYFVGAIVDEPPTIDLKLRGIQSAITPIALLPIECQVKDDYGVDSLTALVARSPADDTENETPESGGATDAAAPLSVSMTPDRDGKSDTQVDLRELTNSKTIEPLVPGRSISVYAEAKDRFNLDGTHLTTSEVFRLQVVTPEELLTLLERRELGLRTRLEQTVTETQGLRDQLAKFKADGFDGKDASDGGEENADADGEQSRSRALQIIRLRLQQSGLQATKTSQELVGIAESLDDLLQEMVNNRIDSQDRQERLGSGVRDPLRATVDGAMQELMAAINAIELTVEDAQKATDNTNTAIAAADRVLLELSAVLEKMLDLESYNELLDLVRGLIQDQEALQEETKKQRKNAIKSLFD